MPDVWLDRPCEKRRDMPDVCMCCGEEATERVKRKFKWVPPWVGAFGGGLLYFIFAAIYGKNCTVAAPLCEQHRGHWFNRALLVWLSLAGGLVVGGALTAVTFALIPHKDEAGMAFLWLLPVGIGWVVCVCVAHFSSIRNMEITDDRIKLLGVCTEFKEAYREWLQEQKGLPRREALERWGERQEKRPARRRDRDDDDDRYRREDDRRRGRDEDDRPRKRRPRDEDDEY